MCKSEGNLSVCTQNATTLSSNVAVGMPPGQDVPSGGMQSNQREREGGREGERESGSMYICTGRNDAEHCEASMRSHTHAAY